MARFRWRIARPRAVVADGVMKGKLSYRRGKLDFLVRRVYDGLRGEGGYGTCACGVKYLEDLARNVEWPEESLSRGKAKELAKFVVEASWAGRGL